MKCSWLPAAHVSRCMSANVAGTGRKPRCIPPRQCRHVVYISMGGNILRAPEPEAEGQVGERGVDSCKQSARKWNRSPVVSSPGSCRMPSSHVEPAPATTLRNSDDRSPRGSTQAGREWSLWESLGFCAQAWPVIQTPEAGRQHPTRPQRHCLLRTGLFSTRTHLSATFRR